MDMIVHRRDSSKEKILAAIDTLADPIRETMSPKGRNVILQNRGEYKVTNDGATIAKSIHVSGSIENAVIQLIKQASLKTNTEVGDGTSTSILYAQVLIKEGFKLVENGMNPMDVKREYERVADKILAALKDRATPVKNDSDLEHVARVSANSDPEIAKNVVRVVKAVGEHGMVFLENNPNKLTTEIEENLGFQIASGMFAPELRNDPRQFAAVYKDIPVFVTDKRLYYEEEAETILKTVMMAGYKQVAIVARDFIGAAVNFLISNHLHAIKTEGREGCRVLMVKDPNVSESSSETLSDLATYLKGKVISDKNGKLVDNIEISDFSFAARVYSDGAKTIIEVPKRKNKELADLVGALKKELEKDKNDDFTKKRLASLTSGMVTVKVGGNTQLEITERLYRYEDAIQAGRAAVRDGYLIGAGVTMLEVFETMTFESPEMEKVFRKLCEASVRQILANYGGLHEDSLIALIRADNTSGRKGSRWVFGFDSNAGDVVDLQKAGVLDPYKVTEMAVRNSISVAAQIVSSGFLVLEAEDSTEDK